jgi:predicted nicotinamide N-methyase
MPYMRLPSRTSIHCLGLMIHLINTVVCVCVLVDVLYAAPKAHGIVNIALQREYSPDIVFIFSQGRKDLYNV